MTVRGALGMMRTGFFVGIWAFVALGFFIAAIRTGNAGFFFIGITVLIAGSLITRAPDDERLEGAFSDFGRFLIGSAAVCAVVGLGLVWLG